MGILNITPDSFSDGGQYLNPDLAIQHALQMKNEGADMIDIGGESTRPGADPISVEEELRRVLPVIEVLVKEIDLPLSIDTRKAEVARKALLAGAHLVNDISGLHYDSGMADVIAEYQASVIIMHSKGIPKTMQDNPQYHNVVEEIRASLLESVQLARDAGISDDQIILDPGIGFGKTVHDNFEIIAHLGKIRSLGYPVLMGVSRKSFIGKTLNCSEEKRIFGTAAAVAASILNGAQIVRVHDVRAMHDVARVIDQIQSC